MTPFPDDFPRTRYTPRAPRAAVRLGTAGLGGGDRGGGVDGEVRR